ncbi:MAG: MBL fold metallo-hydrolase [Thermoplasmata archaeon]|nr:MBL fold metallo-hydrolase [Thermoplasmata archaeon]
MQLKILGSGQDAGTPHTGCFCKVCTKARKAVKYRRLGPSVAFYDKKTKFCYLIDASPDFKLQLEIIMQELKRVERKGRTPLSGIFLTHAHFGHIAGLWQLGWEALAENNLPVYCTSKMLHFLNSNYPFSLLVKRKNIKLQELRVHINIEFGSFNVKIFEVPHRNEIADTVGYVIESSKRIVYLPDLDRWNDTALKEVQKADIAFIDGTFFHKSEFAQFSKVPHPPIQDTIERLGDAKTEIYFTHINHTNPVNINGQERKYVVSKGFKVADDGLIVEI